MLGDAIASKKSSRWVRCATCCASITRVLSLFKGPWRCKLSTIGWKYQHAGCIIYWHNAPGLGQMVATKKVSWRVSDLFLRRPTIGDASAHPSYFLLLPTNKQENKRWRKQNKDKTVIKRQSKLQALLLFDIDKHCHCQERLCESTAKSDSGNSFVLVLVSVSAFVLGIEGACYGLERLREWCTSSRSQVLGIFLFVHTRLQILSTSDLQSTQLALNMKFITEQVFVFDCSWS